MAGNINAHSSIWNSYCYRRQNATILEDFIKQFGLFINNESECTTYPSNKEVSVINLVLFTAKLELLIL